MDPGTIDVVLIIASLVVKLPLTFALLGWDERRLARKRPDLFARTWPPATRLHAIVVFQELGVLVHFWRTRRYRPRGFLLGLVAALGILIGTSLVLAGLEAALGAT